MISRVNKQNLELKNQMTDHTLAMMNLDLIY